jgi:hypothetical protein
MSQYTSNEKKKPVRYVPVYDAGQPGRVQQPVYLPATAPVYSVYSGKLVAHGPVPVGTPGDAPHGHANYGKDFHVINNVRGAWMMHRPGRH